MGFKVGKAKLPKTSGRISSTSELNAKARKMTAGIKSFTGKVSRGL